MNAAQSIGAGLALLAIFGTGPALACGHCVEDRNASVYDHVLVQRTLASNHRIAYFAWDGPLARNPAARRQLLVRVEATAGVDQGSARVSMEPEAIAVAFDPRRSDATAIEAALRSKLAPLKVSLVPLQPPAP